MRNSALGHRRLACAHRLALVTLLPIALGATVGCGAPPDETEEATSALTAPGAGTPAVQGADGGSMSCGQLFIVFDRSGSMHNCTINGMTREDIAKAAIKTVTDKYPQVPMGLEIFPNTGAGCSSAMLCAGSKVVVEMAEGGAAQVGAWIAAMPTTWSSAVASETGSTAE